MNFLTLIWLFPIALALHEAEEWNILQWYERNFLELPPKTNPTIRTFLVFVSMLGFVWTGFAALWNNPKAAAWILMPYLAVSLQNTLQHIYWLYRFQQYPPGLLSSTLLLGPVVIILAGKALSSDLAPAWYIAALGALQIPGLVETIKADNRLSPNFHKIHNFSVWLADRILPKPMPRPNE
jgi:hypothetical protein